MSCLTICNAQQLLPIKSGCKHEPAGAIDIEFTDTYKIIYLSHIIDWSEGDSYTIKFREPTPTSIHIGKDVIPKGVTSFQGFNLDHDVIQWMASNGEYFEISFAYICISPDVPTKLSVSEVIINRKDGSKTLCYYPDFTGNRQFESKHIHWEAKTGEEFEKFIEFAARLYKVESYSGKVAFGSQRCYVGGPEWAKKDSNRPHYRLKLYSPTMSENFAWKYVTKTGETRYQKIEKNSTVSTLNINEEITECYIVPYGFSEDSSTEYLEIQEVTLTDGSQPKIETLVLWHANGTTTEISLHKKPRVTFSPDKVLIKGSGVNFEYPSKDIIKFTYKKEDIVNEIDAPMNQANFTRDEERIVFNGIKSSDEVVLYKLNGSHVPVHLTHTINGDITFSLSDIPFGVYILNVNGSTYKIVKR